VSWGGSGPIDAAVARLTAGGAIEPPATLGMGFAPETGGAVPLGITGFDPQGSFRAATALDFSGIGGASPTSPSAPTSPSGAGYRQPGSTGYAGGGITTAGGNWTALDAHNPEIASAASRFGVPGNLIKSMINRESSGNWERDNRVYTGLRGQPMLPFVGIFKSTADAWGLDFNAMIGNKQAQIDGMAKILSGLAQQYGGYENAAKVYFGGEGALRPGGFTDELGMSSSSYGQKAIAGWRELDALGGGSSGSGYNGGGYGASPSQVVAAATSYVGQAPYVWGSVPGAGTDPRQSGWDCSGMISWLSSKYAPGSGLPAGSHYQYQWAQQSGNLFRDPSQLKPGDIVFFDTGNRGGGGSYLNGASHVGMYIGGGKMVHAANPNAGTIISDFAAYQNMYQYLGAATMPWSGGGSYSGGTPSTGGSPQPSGPSPMNPAQRWMALLSGQGLG
jgi:cell wall-associated NlpC family hydrolase